MRTLSSDKLPGYALLASVGLFVGLLLHRVEIVLLVAPFAIALVVGLAIARPPSLVVTAELSCERALEGDELAVRFTVTADRAVGRVELAVRVPSALLPTGRDSTTSALVDRPGSHMAELRLGASRWGTFEIGPTAWRARDPARLLRYEETQDISFELRIHPRPEVLRLLVQPARTTPFSGTHTARLVGEGIEFAEVRPFAPGDRFRDVNARVSARRGEPWVNRRHPERHANVVVLLDTSSDVALEQSVRSAVALVTAYAGQHDRVGIIAFGSMIRWVAPGLGDRHLYRVLDALLTSKAPFGYIWRDLHVVPARMLPPNALVWLVSPLEDDRPVGIVHQLHRRSFDVSVLEVALAPIFHPGTQPTDELAHRLWLLRRDARRAALRQMGIAVVEWTGQRSMTVVVEEAAAFRMRRRARAL